jgi:hypothetical protein
MHISYFKIKPLRDPEYLAYIRKQRCVVCGHHVSEACHQNLLGGGKGTKVGDDKALPNCVQCHRFTEHGINGGILTLWNMRSGLYFENKHPLRDYLRLLCYFNYNGYLLRKLNKR